MANALKSTFSALAPILGETPDTLYGWQRAMVREGILDAVPGRGPGSGVAASPKTMAQFLIGACCHASRSENAPLVTAVTMATALTGPCALTGRRNFGDALTAILEDAGLASRVFQVTISATAGGAGIVFDKDRTTSFWEGKRRKAPAGIQFSAMIWGPTLLAIAKEVLS